MTRPALRFILLLIVSVALGGALDLLTVSSLAAADAPAPEVLLKARVAQLEAQLLQASSEQAVCSARLAMASAPAMQQQQQQQRAAIEKEAGCTIDWAVSPPACKPSPPPASK